MAEYASDEMTMFKQPTTGRKLTIAMAIFTSSLMPASALAQSNQGNPTGQSKPATTAPSAAASQSTSHYHSAMPNRAQAYYQLLWGVDSLTVRSVESGELIRFNYRVLDAEKAQALNDKKSEPYLIDERARVKLVVPSLEKVGQLRQSSAPEAGKVYWMAFSNKGGYVKRGDHVIVVIGKFHADGLIVE